MKLTRKQQRDLVNGGNFLDFCLTDIERLGNDNHGIEKVLAIITDGTKMLGFYYEETSEEWIFEDQETFEIYTEEVIVVEWKRNDKKSHWS